VLPSLVAVEFQMNSEFALHPDPLYVSHLSFRLSRCISDPRCGWAEEDVFCDRRCMLVYEREKAVVVLVTRQSRASDGPGMRPRRSMRRAKDSGSMQRRRRKEIGIDGKRGARQDNETSTGRWLLKLPRTLVLRTQSSKDLAKTRLRIEKPSWVTDVTNCERPKASMLLRSRFATSSGLSRMSCLKSPTMRSFSLLRAIFSRRDSNYSRKTD
jgi:hypothetical protein